VSFGWSNARGVMRGVFYRRGALHDRSAPPVNGRNTPSILADFFLPLPRRKV
jgi:hypothetical protein